MRKAEFVRDACRILNAAGGPTRVVVAHRDLLGVIRILERMRWYSGAIAIMHGMDVWTSHRRYRVRLLSGSGVRTIAVSNFTAGALMARTCASVLSPGLSRGWFEALESAGPREQDRRNVLTVLRLAAWREKGIPTLLDALRQLDDHDLSLTVCGSGEVPEELREALDREPRCKLVVNLNDADLAREYASAFVVVLATRTRSGSRASGEGFGMVLLEAQVAGAPIIAPAYGGSGDAFQPGLTGLAPTDESAKALAIQLRRLVEEPGLRDRMAEEAATWSRARFDPDAHAERVLELLLAE
jgi:phosphatidylinositol alpha-1,6-mannosyltransferase